MILVEDFSYCRAIVHFYCIIEYHVFLSVWGMIVFELAPMLYKVYEYMQSIYTEEVPF